MFIPEYARATFLDTLYVSQIQRIGWGITFDRGIYAWYNEVIYENYGHVLFLIYLVLFWECYYPLKKRK